MSDQPQDTQNQQVFEIQKLYLKDVSFEAPNSPQVFTGEWKPESNVQLSTEARKLDEHVNEVVLNVTVTTRCDEQTAYLVELKQAGVFTLKGFSPAQLSHLLGSYCPNMLFAFAREAIVDLVAKGGFPQFLLNPVNFDALYAEHQKKLAQQQKTGTSTVTH